MLVFAQKNSGMARVLIGDVLQNEHERLQQRVTQLQQSFMAKGFSANEALNKAYQVLDYSVMKQSTVQSYMDVFMGLGIMFLICVPFVLVVKGNRKKKVDLGEAMH
mgnify:CR=1 FL=1